MRTVRCACLILFATALSCLAAGKTKQKKLIEFGWDEPDPGFIRRHSAVMEKTPFDGCVFHVNYKKPDGKPGSFTWEAWSKRAFQESDLQPALDDMKAAKAGRFKENFLRFNTTPADIDWFDDYSVVLRNARLAAWFARQARLPGILFDIEQYNGKLFEYGKQRDAATKSWEQYAAQVRLRGRQVMEAFQKGYPGLTVFLTFGHSYPFRQTKVRNRQLKEVSYGLLVPFVDGLIDVAKGRTKIVDGHESAYSYREPERFPEAYQLMKAGVLPIVADPKKYARVLSFSFGIWMDADHPKIGWHTDDFTKNRHTPERFEVIVRKALETTDEYVWIYSEKLRWWSDPEGKPVNLPEAYDAALRRARGR